MPLTLTPPTLILTTNQRRLGPADALTIMRTEVGGDMREKICTGLQATSTSVEALYSLLLIESSVRDGET